MNIIVKNNAIINREGFKKWLSTANDGDYTVKKSESLRSIQLNKYYWGVVIKIFSGELGWDKDDTHVFFKDMFLKENIVVGGNEVTKIPETKNLTNQQFIQYCKEIQLYASVEHRINIPDPNEADFEAIAKHYKL